MPRVIGLMSGTSVDGIDAALVELTGLETDLRVQLLAGMTYPYPSALKARILEVCAGDTLTLAEFAELDDAIAVAFAQAALAIQANHPPAELIGSHGQTVFHRPAQVDQTTGDIPALGYSLQLGRGALIAHLTGITTVSNFRVADIALGGQGAPLVPRVDAYLLSHPTETRCVQNLGGIGNVAFLPPRAQPGWEREVRGWDTGPGNVLLDLAVSYFSGGSLTYDQDGAWAASGSIHQALVDRWLKQDFFQQPPPKSTGREHFGPLYLQNCLADTTQVGLSAADTLATLTELTAASIAHSYTHYLPQLPDQIILCGGGSRNQFLRERIAQRLAPIPVTTTDDWGLSADYKEAIAFAVLAYWRQQGIPGNLPQVTGAYESAFLGEVHGVGESVHGSIGSRL